MFFDIGIGLLITSAVGMSLKASFSWWLVVVGLFGALWPDFDFIVYVGSRYVRGIKPLTDRWSTNHRDLLHRPLVLTPLITVSIGLCVGSLEAVIFCLATLAHFIHDTIGHGWGILLFWPLDNHFYCYRPVGSRPYAFYRLTRAEQVHMIEQFGRDQWVQQSYGHISSELKIELVTLSIGLTAVAIWYVLSGH